MKSLRGTAEFDLPVAVLAASAWTRVLLLLPLLAILWLAVAWAMGE
ncbi:MAG TPA: hypothetical protein VF194_04625 [Ferrovibrio sp.]|jgi:hypothetical protein